MQENCHWNKATTVGEEVRSNVILKYFLKMTTAGVLTEPEMTMMV